MKVVAAIVLIGAVVQGLYLLGLVGIELRGPRRRR